MEHRVAAIEESVKRHESIIEDMRSKLNDIHESTVRIETQLSMRPKPGESPFCVAHLKAIDTVIHRQDMLERDLVTMKRDLARYAGGAIVVLAILQMVGPKAVELILARI